MAKNPQEGDRVELEGGSAEVNSVSHEGVHWILTRPDGEKKYYTSSFGSWSQIVTGWDNFETLKVFPSNAKS